MHKCSALSNFQYNFFNIIFWKSEKNSEKPKNTVKISKVSKKSKKAKKIVKNAQIYILPAGTKVGVLLTEIGRISQSVLDLVEKLKREGKVKSEDVNNVLGSVFDHTNFERFPGVLFDDVGRVYSFKVCTKSSIRKFKRR